MPQHIFIQKSVFFPENGILAVGDLHLGYEHSLRESGILIPETQLEDIINNLKSIIETIKKKNYELKKIVFLGDLKHYFSYEKKEKDYINKIFEFLKNYVRDSDIILIKGNHDKFDFAGKKMKNYYFSNGIMFFHGHMSFPQILDEKVKTWVIGHLHPSVFLSDKANIKREKYKCFLTGKYNEKEVIIAPSFFGMIEGTPVNEEYYENEKEFSVIPHNYLKNFEVNAINDDGEVFDFGKVKNL
ncbi:MAG: metallophosphoesterase [Nanoarchaeota archaeon]